MVRRIRRTSFLEVSGDVYHSSHSYNPLNQSTITNDSIVEEGGGEDQYLLPRRRTLSSDDSRRFKITRLLETVAYFCGNFSVGILVSVIGPTLKDLAHNIHTDIDTISLIYTVRAVGYLITTLILGWCIERLNFDLFFGLATILAAGASLAFPYIDHMIWLCLAIFTHGVVIGCVDTGGNVMIIRLWKRQAGPFIQALSFFLGLGTSIGPFIIHLFPGDEDDDGSDPIDVISTTGSPSLIDKISNIFDFGYDSSTPDYTNFTSVDGVGNATEAVTYAPYIPIPTNSLLGIYGVAGALTAASAIYLLILFLIQVRNPICLDNLEITHMSVRMRQKPAFTNKICALLFFFFMGYQGIIIAYGSLIAPFVRSFNALHISRLDAATMNSVYWGAFAVGRLVCIPISRYVHPRSIILVDLVGSVASSLVLLFYADSNLTILWVFNGLLGLSYASVFPAMWAWAERYLEITGRVGALLMVGSAIGEMSLPPMIGEMYGVYSGMALMYVTVGVSILIALIFALLNFVVYECGTRVDDEKEGVTIQNGNSGAI